MASTRTRGITAAIVLAAAIIGLPVVLGQTVGNPIAQWPSLSSGQLPDTGVIAILATVFWLAWLTFVIPAALEIVLTVIARATRHPQRQIRLPLLGAQQDLARNLISAALLLLPAASTAIATASPATHPPVRLTAATLAAETQQQPTTTALAHHKPANKTYVIPDVGGMRSYWALAEHFLGDGARWREIWHLNEGRVHADGTVMDSPRQLHAGWTILIPTDVEREHQAPARTPSDVIVKPGDTLSGIAATTGARDWQQLWRLNADRAEPHHTRLTDPNLIRPGWTITLPEAASQRPAPTAPTNGRHHTAPKDSAPAPHHPVPLDPGPRAGRPDQPSQHPPAVKPTEPSGTATNGATPTAGATSHNDTDVDHGGHRFPAVPLGIGLAAAAAVATLDRARRITQRRRRVGHRPLPPPEPLRRVEADLRHAARTTHPAIAAVELATALTATSPTPVDISAVTARDDGAIDLHLQPPGPDVVPPPPFVAIPGGWRLPAAATGFTFAVDSVDEPLPTLAPVGRGDDGEVLIDLARRGPVSIAGDAGAVARYLIQLAEALLAAPWSGRVFLTVPAALREQLGDKEHVTVTDGPPRLPSVVPSAATGAEEPGWCTTPIYLYLGWPATDTVDDLLYVAADPDASVYAVLIGLHDATTVWTLDGDQLTIPGIDQPLTVTLPDPDQPTAADLIIHTRTAEHVPVDDPRLPDHTLDAPPHRATTSRQLNVLGPVELAGVDTPKRTQILNLLTYLALHRRGADHDTLDTVLWKKPVGGKTLRNRMHEARQLVGGAISDGPIWRLTDEVTTDWQRFTALAAGDPAEQREALQLVRGRPFEGLDYADWLDLEGIRSEVEAAIVDLALTVTERELDAGAADAAYLAARAGLDATRYEERLHRLAIRAARAAGHSSVVDTLKDEMRTAIEDDIEPDGALQPETLELYERMRRGRTATGR